MTSFRCGPLAAEKSYGRYVVSRAAIVTILNSEPRPPDREVLTGLVERVTYQNAENGFCVLRVKARGQRELVTLVGHAATISAGEWVTATGDWVNDRTHGQQFKARFLKTSAPTSVEGIEKYLASGMIRGIGPVYAKKLLRAFTLTYGSLLDAPPPPPTWRQTRIASAGAVYPDPYQGRLQGTARPQIPSRQILEDRYG